MLIDGELSGAESREVQQHLSQCFECQKAQADFLGFRGQLGNYVPRVEPFSQTDALNRILNRKPAKVAARSTSRPAWTWSFSPRLAAFATLILLAAIIGFVVYQSVNRKQAESLQAQAPKSAPVQQSSPENASIRNPESKPTPVAPAPSPTPQRSPAPKVPVRPRPNAPSEPNFATNRPQSNKPSILANVRASDTQTLTAMHLEKSELLLRAFRNLRPDDQNTTADVTYERKQAQQLILQNMMLRREADSSGDVQVASLLENLEPILLDIANLPKKPDADDIRVINERVERKNIVALLQVNSTMIARALDDD